MKSAAAWSLSLALCLLGAAIAAEPSDGELTLDALLARMATTQGVAARFHERKELALLSAPLETRGSLYFAPPDRLARFVSEPAFSALIIDGPSLRFLDAEGGEAVDLSQSPVARAFAENFVVLFNGDRSGLERIYTPELRDTGATWELHLTPRDAPLKDVLEAIVLRGDRDGLREMEVRDVDGDRSVTVFDAVEMDRAFSAAELERLFAGAAPLPETPR